MDTKKFLEYLENGPFAWPGGYPIYFITKDGAALSFEAAKEEQAQILDAIREPGTNTQWEIVAAEINWEDASLFCDHTGKRIESAYAD